ncbi:hypothetical protein I7I50_07163 [Histoplasma capsulatum G186AR]|uniref:Uncharacterized protein n=1 Tax=Ajellomyces capsulatus TaxID=5037 RepID=A0A8H7YYC2_AJECA|nr:hypothetical protein I7I52_09770 [Histoplasma capsulatum]QSS67932.1 hypothetical protein I7I50_07163 [Histoplasma capsulatum G186AR]
MDYYDFHEYHGDYPKSFLGNGYVRGGYVLYYASVDIAVVVKTAYQYRAEEGEEAYQIFYGVTN